MKRPVAHADQTVHVELDRFHSAADFAVFAFADADSKPRICALLAINADQHRLEMLALQVEPFAQRLKCLFRRASINADTVFAQPARGG